MNKNSLTFRQILLKLQEFWAKEGCNIVQPYDVPAGAGTFHPAMLLRSLESKPWSTAYVTSFRCPTNVLYVKSPNKLLVKYKKTIFIKCQKLKEEC